MNYNVTLKELPERTVASVRKLSLLMIRKECFGIF